MSSSRAHHIGIDFGTTNTSIAAASPDGAVTLARFPFLGQLTAAYRSLLYFEQHAGKSGAPPATFCWTGPSGIEHYLKTKPININLTDAPIGRYEARSRALNHRLLRGRLRRFLAAWRVAGLRAVVFRAGATMTLCTSMTRG